MERKHKVGISSFAYCFACGTRPFQKPEHIMTPFDLIDKAAETGAEVVQIGDNMPLEAYSDETLEKIRLHAEARGIELEAGMRMATEERLSAYISMTQKIGARLLRVITDGAGYEPTLQECCLTLSSVTSRLEESGVILGIENHDRFRTGEYANMVKIINHPRIGLTVDTVNSMSIEEPIGDVLKNMAPYCACMHIKDYVIERTNGRGGLKITGACPGTGRLNIPQCYEECRARSGYDFSLILESWMEPCETLEKTLNREDEWARTGIELLKNIVSG